MSYPLPLTRTEAYLAYKAGVIQQSDLKPSLAVPRIGIDAWLAYWTELTNDYPKNPDGTPMILQEEEAYIAYLCGVLDTYPEKCLRRVGAYLRYIISARWGRPDHPLNREELYLSLIKTQFIPSGDPSSDITIDGTAKAPFVDVKMYGDTYQQSYSGKNLFQIPDSSTIGGVTLTKNIDGSFGLSGTATTDIEFSRVVNLADSGIVGSQSYTISSDAPIETYGISYYVHSVNSIGKWNKTLLGFRSEGTQTAAAPSTDYIKFVVRVANGTAVNYPSIKTMLEAGSTASSFEPYTGGQASPSPSYPQPIQVVTGEQTVEVRGKNLFNIDNYSSAVLRGGGTAVSVTKENATTLKLTNLVSQGANFCGIPIPNSDNLLGKTVTISGNITLGTGAADASVAVYAGTSSSVGTAVASRTITASGSFSLNANIPASYPSGANMIHFVIYASGNSSPTVGSTVLYSNLQMEAGSTPTVYESYSSNDYKINLGKNLLAFGFAGDSIGNITVSYDGSEVVLNGKKTGQGNIHNTSSTLTTLQAGTYTVSSRKLSGSADNDRIRLIVRAGSSISFTTRTNISSAASSYTFTLDSAQVVSFQIWSDGTCTCDNLKIGFMIEAGSQATAYAQFFEPIELCKLGNYQDYIWKDGGDWKIHKATSKYTFKGTEQWDSTGAGNHSCYSTAITNYATSDNVPYSPRFSGISNVSGAGTMNTKPDNSIAFIDQSATVRFYIRSSKFENDAPALKTWLSTHNTDVYYALATPTDITITDQALIDQLEALVKGGSEEGTTYIKVSATDSTLPGLLYVEAAKYV